MESFKPLEGSGVEQRKQAGSMSIGGARHGGVGGQGGSKTLGARRDLQVPREGGELHGLVQGGFVRIEIGLRQNALEGLAPSSAGANAKRLDVARGAVVAQVDAGVDPRKDVGLRGHRIEAEGQKTLAGIGHDGSVGVNESK